MNPIAVANPAVMSTAPVRPHARGQVLCDAQNRFAARSSSLPAYAAIIDAFPADVAVEIDNAAGVVAFRIAGNRVSVMSEVERIAALVTARGAMVRFMGPIKWGGLWEISHGVFGELRILP
jgi:hypothetical protein